MVTATAGIAAASVARGKTLVNRSGDELAGRIDELKKRIDSLEENQKNFIRTLCVVTALSTGIDLSMFI
jgi:hypothetical protein